MVCHAIKVCVLLNLRACFEHGLADSESVQTVVNEQVSSRSLTCPPPRLHACSANTGNYKHPAYKHPALRNPRETPESADRRESHSASRSCRRLLLRNGLPAHPPLAHSPRLCPPARERCVNPLIVPRWKARSGPRGSRQGLARARTRIDPVKNMEEEGRSQQEQGCIGMQRGDQDGKVQERRERRQTRTGWPPRGPGTRPRPLKQGSQIHDTKRSP